MAALSLLSSDSSGNEDAHSRRDNMIITPSLSLSLATTDF